MIWLTGLPASGKTTLALRVEQYISSKNYKVIVLDGDNIRNGLNKDLGFTKEDRHENLRRAGEVTKLLLDAGIIVVCAFISPYAEDRASIKRLVGENRYIEMYVNCTLEECERRDPKGLYKKAKKENLNNFTGLTSPYEAPVSPDIEVKTNNETVEESLFKIIKYIAPLIT